MSPAAAFSQPGSAGLGMGSAMMATPQAAATVTAQTAQAAAPEPVQKVMIDLIGEKHPLFNLLRDHIQPV